MLKKSSIIAMLLACFVIVTGCRTNYQQNGQVFSKYHLTALKWTKSADILPELAKDAEIITQNESIVASWNKNNDSSQLWFNIVAFDEEKLTANRKYAFFMDEKANGFKIGLTQKLRFDAELVLPDDIVSSPYTSANAKRLAVIKYIRATFAKDIAQLAPDSKELETASMMVAQSLNHCIYPIEQSPALAKKLSDKKGMEFDHMNFDAGRVRMIIADDIVKIKIKIGTIVEDFQNQKNVKEM